MGLLTKPANRTPMNYEKNLKRKILDVALLIPIAYVLTVMWLIPEGYKYTPVIIIFSAFIFILLRGWDRVNHLKHNNPRKSLYLTIIAITLFFALTYKLNDGNISELRTLVSLCIYLTIIYNHEISENFWKNTITASGFLFVAICFYQFFWAGLTRATLNYNPIPFATALGSSLLCVTYFALFNKSKFRLFYFGLSLLLLFALGTTGTRGVILPVVIIIITTILYTASSINKKSKLKTTLVIFLTALSLGTLTHISSDRITNTISDLEKVSAGELTGSIGMRLQFWKAAIELSKQKPILGLGERHRTQFQELSQTKILSKEAIDYAPRHYHNQFLDNLVKRGILGLTALFATLVIPLILARRHLRTNPWRFWTISSLVFLYFFAGLTDVPFNHPPVIFTYYMIIFSMLPTTTNAQSTNATVAK